MKKEMEIKDKSAEWYVVAVLNKMGREDVTEKEILAWRPKKRYRVSREIPREGAFQVQTTQKATPCIWFVLRTAKRLMSWKRKEEDEVEK